MRELHDGPSAAETLEDHQSALSPQNLVRNLLASLFELLQSQRVSQRRRVLIFVDKQVQKKYLVSSILNLFQRQTYKRAKQCAEEGSLNFVSAEDALYRGQINQDKRDGRDDYHEDSEAEIPAYCGSQRSIWCTR